MNKKGFIGSIGDDFPSLIPLFFAVLLFFSSMAYAFTTIDDRDEYMGKYIESLNIAKTALGDGSYTDYEEFENRMQRILTPSNYIIGLVYIDSKTLESAEDSEIFSKIYLDRTFIRQEDEKLILAPYYEDSDPEEHTVIEIDSEEESFSKYSSLAYETYKNVPFKPEEISKTRNLFTYVYPASLSTPKGAIPVFLVIYVW